MRRFLVLVVPILTLAVACHRQSSAESTAVAPVRVAVVTAERVVEPDPVLLPGTVRAIDRAVIAAKVAGTVTELPWGLGQSVKAGELLVRLSAPEYAAQSARARAQLEQAERELARDRELSERGAGTDEAVRRDAEQVKSAKAAVAEADAMVSYTEIKAPFDGRITGKQAYPGDMALPGQSLLSVEGVGRFEVEVAVPESYVANINLGAAVPVEIREGWASATVAEIAAGADVASRSVMVKLRLSGDARVSSGQFVRVKFSGPAVPMVRIPASAVTNFGQMERVFVVSDGKAGLRLVKTGERAGGQVAVLAGLDPGEKLIDRPDASLRDGQRVEVQP